MSFIRENESGHKTVSNKYVKFLWNWLHDYNHEKYWKRREIIINPKNKTLLVLKLFYLFYIKRRDIKHHSSFGTDLNRGAKFKSPPRLPHGPYGIIIGLDTILGTNVTIFHQVTIMDGNVTIGNNVLIGSGAKILPNVKIGNNVKIGANCVVIEDIPDNATVVLHKPRIILKNE